LKIKEKGTKRKVLPLHILNGKSMKKQHPQRRVVFMNDPATLRYMTTGKDCSRTKKKKTKQKKVTRAMHAMRAFTNVRHHKKINTIKINE
jgi:hypothetical protein